MVLNLAVSQSQHFHSGDPLQEILSTALALLAWCPRSSRKIPFPSIFPPVHCQPWHTQEELHTQFLPVGIQESPAQPQKKPPPGYNNCTRGGWPVEVLKHSKNFKPSLFNIFLPKREHCQENYTQTDTHIPAALHQKVKGGRKISSLLDLAVLLHP